MKTEHNENADGETPTGRFTHKIVYFDCLGYG